MNIFAAGTDSVQRCGYSSPPERKKAGANCAGLFGCASDMAYCWRTSITGVMLGGLALTLTLIITALVGEMTTNRFEQFAPVPVKVQPAGSNPTPDELMA
jgi:hypothetical protein